MKIEAVQVCVGYADFLRETLPRNLPHFDRVVIVTSFDDRETISLCQHLSVQCVPTDVHKLGGDVFNKGRMLDLGLSFCRRDDWVCILDADIYLPPLSRKWIERAILDPDCIYGIDRVNCVGWERWKKYLATDAADLMQHWQHCLVAPPAGMPLGARISLIDHAGYVPIGYFQLFHGKHNRRHPVEESPSAEHSDVLFSLQWPTRNRRLMGELFAIHLESEPGVMGANWRGRKTKRFEPTQNYRP